MPRSFQLLQIGATVSRVPLVLVVLTRRIEKNRARRPFVYQNRCLQISFRARSLHGFLKQMEVTVNHFFFLPEKGNVRRCFLQRVCPLRIEDPRVSQGPSSNHTPSQSVSMIIFWPEKGCHVPVANHGYADSSFTSLMMFQSDWPLNP